MRVEIVIPKGTDRYLFRFDWERRAGLMMAARKLVANPELDFDRGDLIYLAQRIAEIADLLARASIPDTSVSSPHFRERRCP